MTSRKLAASFGSDCVEIKQEQIPADIYDDDHKSKDDESCEDDWVKVDDVLERECTNSPENIEITTPNDLAKDNASENESKGEDKGTVNQQLEEQIEENKENSVALAEKQNKNSFEENRDNKENNETKICHNAFIFTPIPAAYPREKIIVAYNLAAKTNRYDLIEAFSKYGKITHIQKAKLFALIAYSSETEAQTAAQANNKLEICGRTIGVRVRDIYKRYREYPSSQLVFIFDLLPYVPDEVIKNHFSDCGVVTAMPFYRCRNGINRILIFDQPGSANAALRLDGSLIENTKIRVKPRAHRADNYYDGRTIVMFNEDGFVELEKSLILDLFADCGQIEECDVLCNKKKLAIVTFSDEAGAENAMKRNNTTIGKIKIRLEPYNDAKYKHTKIIVCNLAPGITGNHIVKFFEEHVEVDNVHFVSGRPFALIEFVNTDDYCRAFRLDGELLFGQDAVLKPFSDKDESLEHILYGNDDWIAIWGDRTHGKRGRRRRHKK